MKPKQKAPAKQVWTVKQNSEVTEKVYKEPTQEKEMEIQTCAQSESTTQHGQLWELQSIKERAL